jgi:hypothetical protein
MKQYFMIAFAILLVPGIAACAPVAPMTEQPTPTLEPASTDPYHALRLTTETGIQPIDQVLNAVASGDPQAVRAAIEFIDAECTQQEGLGGPPKCREGEAEGTLVEVLAFLGSEGGHLRKDELENGLAINATGIYAVYEVNTAVVSSEQYYPVGNYVILFVDEENRSGTALRIGERGIVRVDTLFDTSPESLDAMIEREASRVILAPKS